MSERKGVPMREEKGKERTECGREWAVSVNVLRESVLRVRLRIRWLEPLRSADQPTSQLVDDSGPVLVLFALSLFALSLETSWL